ncbi:MAG TPA: hypothetical protein VHM24_00635 [Gemmatimonadaceae bacterium]|nr:hypothetical protein [Gemmatimonadaceae bacterium]
MEIRPLDDLPKFSPWPARLMGLAPWEPRVKTPAEIEREFGMEKWGGLLERFRATPGAGLADVDSWAAGSAPALASVGEHLVLMTPEESHSAYLAYVANALQPYSGGTALVELGCGYGSVILGLARRAEFAVSLANVPLFAADYTLTGPELAAAIAGREGIPLTAGRCDLTTSPATHLAVPEGAVVYTAYAAQYIEPVTTALIEGITALRPKAVVHVEPVYEHCDDSTLLGLMRQRYIQANGYNRNLVTILHDHEARGAIEILGESPAAFGPNPLLAASVIAWSPRG